MCVQLHPTLRCPLGCGWGQGPTSPSFSPVVWVWGRGFHADLAFWCPFAGLGVVLDPHPVPVRGGGGRWDSEIGIFTPFSFCIIGKFFFPRV